MQRREFITLIGGAVATRPLAARAQQPAIPVVGFLNAASPQSYARQLSAFLKGPSEAGYVDGHTTIESRWAEGQNDRLPAMAADLVQRGSGCRAGRFPRRWPKTYSPSPTSRTISPTLLASAIRTGQLEAWTKGSWTISPGGTFDGDLGRMANGKVHNNSSAPP